MAYFDSDSFPTVDAAMLDITASKIYARRQLSPHRPSLERSSLSDDDLEPLTATSNNCEDEMSSAFREHFDEELRRLSTAFGLALPPSVPCESAKPVNKNSKSRFREELDREVRLNQALIAPNSTQSPNESIMLEDASGSSTTLAASLSTSTNSAKTGVVSSSTTLVSPLSQPSLIKSKGEQNRRNADDKGLRSLLRRWATALKTKMCSYSSSTQAPHKTASVGTQAEIDELARLYEPRCMMLTRSQISPAARERNYQRRFGWQNQTEI